MGTPNSLYLVGRKRRTYSCTSNDLILQSLITNYSLRGSKLLFDSLSKRFAGSNEGNDGSLLEQIELKN